MSVHSVVTLCHKKRVKNKDILWNLLQKFRDENRRLRMRSFSKASSAVYLPVGGRTGMGNTIRQDV